MNKLKLFSFTAMIVTLLGILFSSSACMALFYQPKVPRGLRS